MMASVIGAMASGGRQPALRVGLAEVFPISGEEF
jgi:hypothetical protein